MMSEILDVDEPSTPMLALGHTQVMPIESLTLRNYRAFGTAGVTVPLGAGFVGLLGVNNSGKSSLLRAFYELRPLFRSLAWLNNSSQELRGLFVGIQWTTANFSPVVDLQVGERISANHRSNADPRIEFKLSPDSPVETLTAVLTELGGVTRLEAVLRDGRRSEPRTVLWNNYDHSARVVLPIPLNDGTTFEFDWESIKDSLDMLTKSMFVPAFRNALPFAGGRYYDLEVGSALIARYKALKNGSDPNAGDQVVQMTDGLRDVFGFSSLEINVAATDDNFIFVVDGVQRRQAELGSGLAQFVILAVNILLEKPRLLLLDEPELNLHARLQLTFLTFMSSLTEGSVLFATHSLGLGRAGADVLLLASRNAEGDCIIEEFHAASTPAATLGAIGYGGLNDSSFSGVLLVEGASDVRLFQELLALYGVRGAYVVVPLGGGDLAGPGHDQELAELTRLSDKVYAIVDSERGLRAANPIAARDAFAATCASVGIECLVLSRRAVENYLDQGIARAVFSAPDNPTFGSYDRPKDVGAIWVKRENWRIAKQMDRASLARTDLGRFLHAMASRVERRGRSPLRG